MPTGRKNYNAHKGIIARYTLFLAALLFAIYLITCKELDPGNPAVTNTLAVAIIMAVWWMTETVPLVITS